MVTPPPRQITARRVAVQSIPMCAGARRFGRGPRIVGEHDRRSVRRCPRGALPRRRARPQGRAEPVLAEHLPSADPGLADVDGHQGLGIDGVGVLLQDREIGKLARFEGSELVAQADLAGGVAGHRAQGVGQRHRLFGADNRAVNAAFAGHRSLDELQRADVRARRVGVDRERQAEAHAVGCRVHPRRPLGAEQLVAVGRTVEIDMVHEKARLDAEPGHPFDLLGPGDRAMLDPVDAGRGEGAVDLFDRVQREIQRFIAVAVDRDRPALRPDFADHRGELLGVEIGPARVLAIEIGDRLFKQTDLVSDVSGLATITDPNLKNTWGVTAIPGASPFWIDNEGASTSSLYSVTGATTIAPVNLNGAPGTNFAAIPGIGPTGIVGNSGMSFGIAGGPALFIFANLNGTISAWNLSNINSATHNASTVEATTTGASYTGLAINSTGTMLYAANDNGTGSIQVFNGSFTNVTAPGEFVDPNLPSGFVPFNVEDIGATVYVTYAPSGHNQVDAPAGSGVVATFTESGTFIKNLVTGGPLASPWGMALA